MERLRFVGAEPLAIMRNYLPVDLIDLEAVDLEHDGLYATLRRAGILIRVAHQQIGCRRATAAEAARLDGRRGHPC